MSICKQIEINKNYINPLTALDEYICPKIRAACIGYSASYSWNFEKSTYFR